MYVEAHIIMEMGCLQRAVAIMAKRINYRQRQGTEIADEDPMRYTYEKGIYICTCHMGSLGYRRQID